MCLQFQKMHIYLKQMNWLYNIKSSETNEL